MCRFSYGASSVAFMPGGSLTRPRGFSVHGIFPARILEWVAISCLGALIFLFWFCSLYERGRSIATVSHHCGVTYRRKGCAHPCFTDIKRLCSTPELLSIDKAGWETCFLMTCCISHSLRLLLSLISSHSFISGFCMKPLLCARCCSA